MPRAFLLPILATLVIAGTADARRSTGQRHGHKGTSMPHPSHGGTGADGLSASDRALVAAYTRQSELNAAIVHEPPSLVGHRRRRY